jgi:ABC-type nitrate/sulfonate/bicarbonate transport system substrate-binding protein
MTVGLQKMMKQRRMFLCILVINLNNSMISLRVGGVPEHFNYPWHMAIDEGKFKLAGLNILWQSYPGGTGQMSAALRKDECDVCMMLTEGAITDIIKGNPSKIISGYVQTPLTWGIHTAPDQDIKRDQIFDHRIAISRYGSGSHLMAIVHSIMAGKVVQPEQFVVVNDINGAIASLSAHESDIFYWEKFTTKPYVDQGIFKRIDEFVTPWPCFIIVATNNIIKSAPKQLDTMLKIIHEACAEFMMRNDASKLIAEKYEIDENDAREWFHSTEWVTNSWVSDKMLRSVKFRLHQAGILEDIPTGELVWQRDS